MVTLTIRLSDEKHERLRQMARQRKISINKLIEETSTATLAQFDAEVRFRALTYQGSVKTAKTVCERTRRRSFDSFTLAAMADRGLAQRNFPIRNINCHTD